MDTTLAGLLHGCAETPFESTSHLILADWLEDHDQPERAEFIRLQCRLADWVPDWPERQRLLNRQAQMIAEHRERWLGALLDGCESVTFHRGLARLTVRGRTFSTARFQVNLEAQAHTALIEQVQFCKGLYLARLSKLSVLELIPGLSFDKVGLGDDLAVALVHSPRLRHLTELSLANNTIEGMGARTLANSELLQQLTGLDLRNNRIPSDAIQALLDATASTSTPCRLDLTGNQLTPEQIDQLAMSPHPRRRMNSLGMEFVRIPAGSFLRGSPENDPVARSNEKPQHPVTLTRSYWLGRFTVTQAEYEAIMGRNPSEFTGDPRRPVDSITWENASAFCQRLSQLPAERAAGRTYRLPTEAEWEHACRAGGFTPFHHGEPPSAQWVNYDGRYNYGGAPPGPYLRRTAEVGAYPPNDVGLYEMHGNVWEWCSDVYSETSYQHTTNVDP